MKSYDWADLINSLYTQVALLSPAFENDEGMYFRVVILCNYNGYEKKNGNVHHPGWEGTALCVCNFIMLKNHQIFYQVHLGRENAFGPEIPNPFLFINGSNHDSCWRNVTHDILTKYMFVVFDKAHENCPDGEQPEYKSSNVRFYVEMARSGQVFKLVKVKQERDSRDKFGYSHKLTSIKTIKKTIEI